MTATDPFERAIATHDRMLAALGLQIWIGNEPTFTDRYSNAPEWITQALGLDKLERAQQLVAALAQRGPRGTVLLRSRGRQYAGEPEPRWSFGLYGRRDGTQVWNGPPDPLLAALDASDAGAPLAPDAVEAFATAFARALQARACACRVFHTPQDVRVLFAREAGHVLPAPDADPRLLRPSIHDTSSKQAPEDTLAREGLFLTILRQERVDRAASDCACLELPAIAQVPAFCELLRAVSAAAYSCKLPQLVLCGYEPAVDATIALTTVTPDPAVVEVNMAPWPSAAQFLQDNRRCYAAAEAARLQPYRLYFNGAEGDSGGAGQITLGGPAPSQSPFVRVPQLLPRLVRYAIAHPALSYLFAHDYVGPSGQSVRPDERGLDALDELRLSLALLSRERTADVATVFRNLAPCLTDTAGNSHRAEINVEKLWNPFRPGQGQLGLVEFRALRMQQTPERAAAIAALLRAIVARLMLADDEAPLPEWGPLLHDRFALPFYLKADLDAVLTDLVQAGVGLPQLVAAALTADAWRDLASLELEGCRLQVRQGLEFWPLVGDASDQRGTSRVVDSSTARIELCLRPDEQRSGPRFENWQLRACGIELPLRSERDLAGRARVGAVRYRRFVPNPGLHPSLPVQDPITLLLMHPALPHAFELSLYEWRPDGEAYPGPPLDLADAQARRAARCVVRRVPVSALQPAQPAPHGSLHEHSLDLRYLPLLQGRVQTERASDRRGGEAHAQANDVPSEG